MRVERSREDLERRVWWAVASGLRGALGLADKLHPVISTAFVKLEYFLRRNPQRKHPPYVVLVAAIMSSCKTFEFVPTLDDVFRAMLGYCGRLREAAREQGSLEQFLGLSDFTMRSLSGEEIAEMNQCEMEILAAHDFSAHVEQPLDYTDEKVKPFLNNEGIEKAILRLQSMFLCSNRFFDYPHEVVALVITQKALAQCESLPREVQEWIDDVISRFDPAIITATAQMMEETQKRMEETQNRMKK